MKEIFSEIIVRLREILPSDDFEKAQLEIKRLEGNVGWTGFYLDCNGQKNWLDIFHFNLNSQYIHDLYHLTQHDYLQHKNWNRAIFTLTPDNKFDMEYKWGQDLQDEVERYNQELTQMD